LFEMLLAALKDSLIELVSCTLVTASGMQGSACSLSCVTPQALQRQILWAKLCACVNKKQVTAFLMQQG